jgi:hypothetical protein
MTPTQVATAAAARLRVLRERAANRHAKARFDATALRARVQRESKEMMAEAKRRKDGEEENPLVSPWPDEPKVTRYEFDDRPDDAAADNAEAPPRPARSPEPASARGADPDEDDDDNMSQVDTWLR